MGPNANVAWNEHIFFEPRQQKIRDMENAKISLRVLDKGLLKDTVIGLYEFDLSHIYFKDKHVMEHQWVALSNPAGENFNEISGYLKVSISVTGQGDDQVPLTEDDSKECSMIVVPPHIQIQYYQFKIRLFRA